MADGVTSIELNSRGRKAKREGAERARWALTGDIFVDPECRI